MKDVSVTVGRWWWRTGLAREGSAIFVPVNSKQTSERCPNAMVWRQATNNDGGQPAFDVPVWNHRRVPTHGTVCKAAAEHMLWRPVRIRDPTRPNLRLCQSVCDAVKMDIWTRNVEETHVFGSPVSDCIWSCTQICTAPSALAAPQLCATLDQQRCF